MAVKVASGRTGRCLLFGCQLIGASTEGLDRTRSLPCPCHRGDTADRVAPDRPVPDRFGAAGRLHADRIDMHLAAPADQRDETGHAALDMAGHDVVHAAEPRLGKPSGAHGVFPPTCRIRT
jgi:hypothetical protein